MWSYYGAKTNIVHLYPKPKYDKIIEPFAGTARYALRYFEKEVLLVDKYEVIVRIWKWLQQCSPGDILKLPRRLNQGERLDKYQFDCEEARCLMGFLIAKGVESPRNTVTDWVALDRPNFTNFLLKRISESLYKIRHWKIEHGCYTDIPNQKATWFIDPPYQYGGHAYARNNKKIDYDYLRHWSMERQGQVIVCESMKAEWIPLVPLAQHRTRSGWQQEGIWTNEPTAFNNEQMKLAL